MQAAAAYVHCCTHVVPQPAQAHIEDVLQPVLPAVTAPASTWAAHCACLCNSTALMLNAADPGYAEAYPPLSQLPAPPLAA